MPLPTETPPPRHPASPETKEGGPCGKGADCGLGALPVFRLSFPHVGALLGGRGSNLWML